MSKGWSFAAGALVFVAVAALPVAPGIARGAFVALAVLAALVLVARGEDDPPTRPEKLALLTLCLLAAGHLLRWATSGASIEPGALEAPALSVLAVVAAAGLRRVSWSERAWWLALGAGAGALGVSLAGSGVPAIATRWGWELLPATVIATIPLPHFTRGSRHRNGGVRRIGYAGLALCSAFLVAAPFCAPLADARGIILFSSGLIVLHRIERERRRDYLRLPVERAQRLSVTVITKDEADRIRGCLESVHGWADEIVVLDSGSTDGTVSIAREYTDRVYETDWPGYGPQKQRALERATGDWVLSIDADEQVTPELRRDIDEALTTQPEHVGYKTPWAVTIYGRRLDFGRSARAPLRLFRREGTRFTDAQIHETVTLPEGSVGKLEGRLLHFTHRDYGHAMDKSRRYAWLKSQEKRAAGKRSSVVYAWFRAVWDFFVIYCVRLGFLDGQHGLLMATTYAVYAFNKYAGLWTLRSSRES